MKESLKEQLAKTFHIPIKKTVEEKIKTFPRIKGNQIKRGAVIYAPLGEEEGVKVLGGYRVKNKFAVILGESAEGMIIGSLLVNTKANTGSKAVDSCQYPLKESNYKWLDYSSWLDCSCLKEIPRQKVKSARFCGNLNQEDLDLAIKCIQETHLINDKTKKKFGLSKPKATVE